ncbi:4-hydroxy-tetrahydrodipicolinate synthase [Dinghuibacter silviterrae]|uniref:4-hydroxy-tetrahydrodipicolinate synthase n=1 Tax=Dinghuibacter silviterrae TaxID=1539049 RepID=A0A4R8DEX0_9BACT|nr:4-hydroxy-tetrahydrodipicolinate synthase [Dinghuibacter silviterrae]TDW95995.1 4-hydroxy-tetrahydrodipicolinate synthase [Dinghuibacter silviterrae]
MLRTLLRGTGVALVTPFGEDQQVDYGSLAGLIEYVIKGGVEYLVALGTTGEPPVLTAEEKRKVLAFVVEKAAGRVPVVAGVGGNNTASVIRDLETLPLEGTVAVLSNSPYYSKPSQEGIFQHYKAIAAASPKPVILYNVPGRTGSNISAATTIRLAREVPGIAGIKEASGNMVQCMEILRDRPADFLVVSGDDHLALPLIACGMEGVISVAANSWPGIFSRMIRYALDEDYDKAQPLLAKLVEGINLLFAENNPAGVKAFLAEYKVIKNVLRLPLVPLSEPLMEQVRAYAAALGES